MEILAEERILIAYVEAGTNRELRVVFQTDSGEVQVKILKFDRETKGRLVGTLR